MQLTLYALAAYSPPWRGAAAGGGVVILRYTTAPFKGVTILAEGTYEQNVRGFGFIKPDLPGDSVFVAAYDTSGAMHGDRVRYRLVDNYDDYRMLTRARAEITEILEDEFKNIAGIFHRQKRNSYVTPLDKHFPEKIRVLKKHQMKAEDGQLVIVQVKRPGDLYWMDGRIAEILGARDDVGANTAAIIKQSGVPVEFPAPVLNEARRMGPSVSVEEASARKRIDGLVITIDGEDAKDLDDAVTLARADSGNYILGVHIADVNHYVKENSELDKEALRRGTSVYLAGRVLPMLPAELSNGICSLNEGEERLTLSCIMEISPDGEVLSHEIAETVLTVSKRMEYPKATAVLKGGEVTGYGEYLPMLKQMEQLCGILKEKRNRRGAITFDLDEAKAELDESGMPVDIVIRERGIASDIIEEFMLACNETVARDYALRDLPFVFRIHENPEKDKLRKLKDFAASLGYKLNKQTKKIKSTDIQKLMSDVKGKPEEGVITKTALRSLKRARYYYKNQGHYGLAADYYCHFTSPIRRYPDLQIHRIIKESLRGLPQKRINELSARVREVSAISSVTEHRAEELERSVLQLMKCFYMKDKLGQEFSGVISGVTSWGVFVELYNTVEGLAPVREMAEYFEYNEARMCLTGERSGRVFALGGTVDVIVTRVDIEARQIDLSIKREPAEFKHVKKKHKNKGYDYDDQWESDWED